MRFEMDIADGVPPSTSVIDWHQINTRVERRRQNFVSLPKQPVNFPYTYTSISLDGIWIEKITEPPKQEMSMSQSEVTPVYGATNPGPQDTAPHSIKRFGSVIGLEPDKEQYYRQLHANTWPSVFTFSLIVFVGRTNLLFPRSEKYRKSCGPPSAAPLGHLRMSIS